MAVHNRKTRLATAAVTRKAKKKAPLSLQAQLKEQEEVVTKLSAGLQERLQEAETLKVQLLQQDGAIKMLKHLISEGEENATG